MTTANRTTTPIRTHQLPWMPLGDGVSVRPLCFQGSERTLQLKVEPGTVIPLHRHEGYVHALVLSGRRRLGDGCVVGPGDYVFEPTGNVDSWACEGDEPCIIQITMTGRLTYLGEDGQDASYTDTEKMQEDYLAWCRESAIEPWTGWNLS